MNVPQVTEECNVSRSLGMPPRGTAGCHSKGTAPKAWGRLQEDIEEWEMVKLGGNTRKGKDLYGLSSHNSLHWEERQLGATD